ncbi:hypothetical protein CsatB_018521 [Cannabis sativa]|jgi:SAUR family protein|uniref:Uncharacterized protein n=1 Tax=Cannabis sativa TaxID=3483 RepID=A0A803P6Y4_CANSA|nr:auxin-responsive protein SAUR71 [Cannabis sativa]
MKHLIRRLSRVADSSQYCLLRSDASTASSLTRRHLRTDSFRVKLRRRSSSTPAPTTVVPEGHIPVYVGDEMERFVVNAELLNHPVFVELLDKSAQEYGYEQKGVLRIPCHVLVFERVLEALRLGHVQSRDLRDLLGSQYSSDDFICA